MQKIVLLSIAIFLSNISFSQNTPIANPKSIVKVGNARFTVLSDGLIRMEYSKDGRFVNDASQIVINRNLPLVNFHVNKTSRYISIKTDKLKLRYKLNSGEFISTNLEISVFRKNKNNFKWKPGTVDTENLKGTTRTLDMYDGDTSMKDGSKLKLEKGILSKSGWSIFDDSESYLFDKANWQWLKEREDSKSLDYYFFAFDDDYKQALKDFTSIAGNIPMIPRYALGWWWSRYWVYSDKEIRELVTNIDNYDIPIDVMVIDMDWHETYGINASEWETDEFGQAIGWTGYTWNNNLFPDPNKLLSDLHDDGLSVALNLHPASGIYYKESQYKSFAEAINFNTSEDKNIPYQMSDKKWASTYFDTIIRPMEKEGVDFWWLDWQQWKMNKQFPKLNNTWWLNYTFFTDMEKNSNKRPLVFHRWGGLGNHRYPIGFSGDAKISWKTLAYQPYFTSTASNVGYSYWSHDIGGHIFNNEPTDPELYLRWIQYGVFSPILRTHASKNSFITREFWKFPEHFNMMKEALNLRYSLAPYLYNYMHEAYENGVSAIHPMYYEHPKDERSYKYSDQYYFGDDIIVAPITSAIDNIGLVHKEIWLPKGSWYNLSTGELAQGDMIMMKDYSLSEIPVFVNTRTIVPMYDGVKRLKNVSDNLTLLVFPMNSSSFELYEDDGVSNDYKNNKSTLTKIKSKKVDNKLTITIDKQVGSYKNAPTERYFTIRIPLTFMAKKVNVNGENITFSQDDSTNIWSYNSDNFEVVIKTKLLKTNMENVIEIILEEDNTMILSGKKSFFKRLETQVDILRFKSAEKDWAASLPNNLLWINQLQTRIKYNPETIKNEFNDFETKLERLHKAIYSVKGVSENQKKESSIFLGLD